MSELNKVRLLYGIQIGIMIWVLIKWMKYIYIFKSWFNLFIGWIIISTIYNLIENILENEKI